MASYKIDGGSLIDRNPWVQNYWRYVLELGWIRNRRRKRWKNSQLLVRAVWIQGQAPRMPAGGRFGLCGEFAWTVTSRSAFLAIASDGRRGRRRCGHLGFASRGGGWRWEGSYGMEEIGCLGF
ncbi:hypothetical protein HPP92_029164 [Vanilla planifolia]|uniref:Uncharacterized protein n=1 Tax=Vanilla planifolia TaxID=51239 RepID=A0A835U2W6_VANPL|nr:hypothetical protein HPP92_029164 [Vanilla planifolia]KAG0445796.1 hypothetical protein HPP92_029153 [Vanilla planifolia]